jgi:hypothetical protein
VAQRQTIASWNAIDETRRNPPLYLRDAGDQPGITPAESKAKTDETEAGRFHRPIAGTIMKRHNSRTDPSIVATMAQSNYYLGIDESERPYNKWKTITGNAASH